MLWFMGYDADICPTPFRHHRRGNPQIQREDDRQLVVHKYRSSLTWDYYTHTCISIHLSIYPSIHLSINLSIYICVCTLDYNIVYYTCVCFFNYLCWCPIKWSILRHRCTLDYKIVYYTCVIFPMIVPSTSDSTVLPGHSTGAPAPAWDPPRCGGPAGSCEDQGPWWFEGLPCNLCHTFDTPRSTANPQIWKL